jgi:hypothetical protein
MGQIPDIVANAVLDMLASHGRLYGAESTSRALVGFWSVLNRQDPEDVARACVQANGSLRRCPTPHDILELCRGYRKERASFASIVTNDEHNAHCDGVPCPQDIKDKISRLLAGRLHVEE